MAFNFATLEPTKVAKDLSGYTILLYGEPKVR